MEEKLNEEKATKEEPKDDTKEEPKDETKSGKKKRKSKKVYKELVSNISKGLQVKPEGEPTKLKRLD